MSYPLPENARTNEQNYEREKCEIVTECGDERAPGFSDCVEIRRRLCETNCDAKRLRSPKREGYPIYRSFLRDRWLSPGDGEPVARVRRHVALCAFLRHRRRLPRFLRRKFWARTRWRHHESQRTRCAEARFVARRFPLPALQ